ncbi:MAG: YybH family protein [Bernardetiaceae bacterium]
MQRKHYLYGFLFALLCLGSLTGAYAQKQKEDEKAVRGVIEAFAKAYSALSETKDKNAVLQFFDKRMIGNMSFIRIGGRVNVVENNYEKFEAHLGSLISSDGLMIQHKVSDVFHVSLTGEVAAISYQNEFEVTKGKDILRKGSQLVTITQRKFRDGQWRIILYNVTEIEDEKLKGDCLCELFESTDRGIDYVSKVIVPGGTSYNTTLDNFMFRLTTERNTIIKTGNEFFLWQNNDGGDIFTYDVDNKTQGEKIGSDKEKRDVVLQILNHLYADKCTRLITR